MANVYSRPFIRASGAGTGGNIYLPGEIDSEDCNGGLYIPKGFIPNKDGESVYKSGIRKEPEHYSFGGKFNRGDYATVDLEADAIDTFLTNIKASGTVSDYQMEFGWRNFEIPEERYNTEAYIQKWSMKNHTTRLYHQEWKETTWNIEIYCPDPTKWNASAASTTADNIILQANKIILVCNSQILIKNLAGTTKARFTISNGNLEIAGEYTEGGVS